ncbi:transcription termination factor MTERF6, chloroplastic/mitochondrial-like isoform X2 [Cucumis sativus]|uniref:transcription termination factor MTERF6, chloroplastic/mitochondrial-like isoform X2 n=1 Tax=Cucumis sativus TaxID=3659 RepID=UPI0005ECAEA9|nr:transcription termination factor MTERF6, chloroplastic/mitochondrial-like isoform X2 [Cucumis sativus]
MYNLFRRILILRSPSSVFTHGFSESPLKSLRFLSTSSEIVSSPKSASLPSNVVQLKNNRKAVIAFFENHGFSELQISDIVKKIPLILSANPETLFPIFLFFKSKGLSSSAITKLVCSAPQVLKRSLNQEIIPVFDYIQAVLGTVEKTVTTIKRFPRILGWDLRISVDPNIELLKQFGVPDSNISTFLQRHPKLFSTSPIRFKEIVERVTEMGFNPQRLLFVVAVSAMQSITKSTWNKKVEVYRKWGLSEEELSLAFRKNPLCITFSEDKINGGMDFFVNKIGCEPSFVARRTLLISLSLKKRLFPRGFVYQVLLSKGLIRKHEYLFLLFESPEKRFIEKIINPHKEQIPGLLKMYKQKLMDSKDEQLHIPS